MKGQPTPHPATEAFPMLSDDELLDLAADITQNGQIYPIMLDHTGELILDGRNRKRACDIANVKPRYEHLPEELDPIEYIYSTNITRRHMNKGQRAIAMAMLYPEGSKGGRGKKDPAKHLLNSGGAPQFSYDLLNDARRIIQYPDLTIEVRDGGRAFDSALTEAKLRDEIAATGTAHMHRLRNEAPDLAALVDEGNLTLLEAASAFDKRLLETAKAEAEKIRKLYRGIGRMLREGPPYTSAEQLQELVIEARKPGFHERLAEASGIMPSPQVLADTKAGVQAMIAVLERFWPQ